MTAPPAPPGRGRLLTVLLGPRGPFRRFYAAVLLTTLGSWAAVIALSLRMFDSTHSAAWVGALYVAEFVPPVVLGIVGPAFLGRLAPRRAMVSAELVNAALFAVLIAVHEPAAIVLLVTLTGIATAVFRPLVYTAPTQLVRPEELDGANGALVAASNMAWMLGSAAGGAAVAVLGASAVLGVNAASFLVSAALIATLAALGTAPDATEGALGIRERARTGFDRVRRARALVTIATAWTLACLAFGLENALFVPLARGVLDASATEVGVTAATGAAGLALGGLLAGWASPRASYAVLLVVMSGGYAVMAPAPTVAVLALGMLLAGIANGVLVVMTRTRVQRFSEPADRPGLFAVLVGTTSVGTVIGAALAGPIGNALGIRAGMAVAGGVVLLAAVVAFAVEGAPLDPRPAPGEPGFPREAPVTPPVEAAVSGTSGHPTP